MDVSSQRVQGGGCLYLHKIVCIFLLPRDRRGLPASSGYVLFAGGVLFRGFIMKMFVRAFRCCLYVKQ
eukprot:2248579-Amphidinium_carterae.1